MNLFKAILGIIVVAGIAAAAFLYSGLYPIGADVEHTRAVSWALETLRERSIASASKDQAVPALDDPQMLLSGAVDYNDMCAGCHLKPGTLTSELSAGLYPKPPNLSLASSSARSVGAQAAARQFWIIKHGIKASAMPAWGPTHDDQRIWAMVAFLQKLPSLSADQYQILSAHEGTAGALTAHSDPAKVGTPNADASAQAPTDPVGVVQRFQEALSRGDTAGAQALLDPGVQIFESGGIERSREEYAAHHLAADAEFLKSASSQLLSRTDATVGDMAWVGSESRLRAKLDGKDVDVISVETMLLRRLVNTWKIVHIHWSSRKVAAAKR